MAVSGIRGVPDWDADLPSCLSILEMALHHEANPQPFKTRLLHLSQVNISCDSLDMLSAVLELPLLSRLVLRSEQTISPNDLQPLVDLETWSRCAKLEEARFVAFRVSSFLAKALTAKSPKTLKRADFEACSVQADWVQNGVVVSLSGSTVVHLDQDGEDDSETGDGRMEEVD